MDRPRVKRSSPRLARDRTQKGTVNVAEVGKAACKSRAVSTAGADSSVTGYHRCHGEERTGACSCILKSVLDVSVRTHRPLFTEGIVVRARLARIMPTGCARHGYAIARARDELIVSATRDTADHLKRQGFIHRTRELRLGRLDCDSRQAAKPGDVPSGGRSSRSSRSTGKPCTWRRGAADA